MNIFPPVKRAVFLVTISLSALTTSELPAGPPTPDDASLEVIATNGAGVEKHLFSQAGFVGQLVIKPNQAVPVTLQFSGDKIGMPIAIGSRDGGELNGDDRVVSPTGKVLFTFRGTAPGLYRVTVQLPTEQHRIEFYVLDPNYPRRSPR